MKLQNKKTGEIGYLQHDTSVKKLRVANVDSDTVGEYNSLTELNKEWEDYEETKEKYHWFISGRGTIEYEKDADDYFNRGHKAIGNYFETEEEAEKAVEKLKAWKRLKDRGFRFEGIKEDYTRILQSQDPFRTGKRYMQFNKSEDEEWMKENWDDLTLLFGGEE